MTNTTNAVRHAIRQEGVVIEQQLAAYFQSGGLFNPEMADHDKVRNMLIEIQDWVKHVNNLHACL